MAEFIPPRHRLRCAVYTRKSSDEGLDQAFNSLDAQREACEAYVFSQQHEGWRLSPALYDDGGFSGGNMERPGLKALLADVRSGLIDVIVVYKIDRLTRSLTDFTRIVEVLDSKSVSFVSITQAFNTTSSMGRLTLNMLLSFAQFEREITSERIRDKIAASKAKGMWMGGYRPLGYSIQDRGLIPHPIEAPVIKALFERLLTAKGVDALLEETNAEGLLNKLDRRSTKPMSRGALYNMLQNPLYIGQVRHKDKRYPGRHAPIINQSLFDEVQAALQGRRHRRASGERAKVPALLTGLIFDDYGRRYTPTHTAKDKRRYLYYCLADQTQPCHRPRLPGRELESLICTTLIETLAAPQAIGPHLAQLGAQDIHAALAASAERADRLQNVSAAERRKSFRDLVARAIVQQDAVTLELRANLLVSEAPPSAIIELHAKLGVARRGNDIKLVVGQDGKAGRTPDPVLVGLLARACAWLEELASGQVASRAALAAREGVTAAYVGHLVDIAYLAPDLKAAILEGSQPPELTGRTLHRLCPLPLDWAEQRRLIQKVCSR